VIAFLLLAAAAPATPPAKPAAIEAVELCTAVARPKEFNLEPLATAGWKEGEIKNIDQAPGGAAANRLFTREGAGAVIMLNVNTEKGGHYCHVLTSGPSKFIDLFERALVPSVGEAMKLTPALTFYKSTGKPYIVSLSRKPSGKDILADVMVMAFEPKAKAE
jgi:hypothetical protein